MYIFHKQGAINTTLFVLRPDITEMQYAKFVSEFHALPDSEYERLVCRIADLLFFCGENLDSLYQDLYQEEYSDFSSFLEIELGFEEALINSIMEESEDDESLWIINITDYETYNFQNLFDNQIWTEDSLLERIIQVFARCKK